MRILIINCDYPRFLVQLYSEIVGLHNAPYAEQLRARNASLFGVADFYSRGFIAHGHEAAEMHVNNPWMQTAWAREHGMSIAPPPDPLNRGVRLRFQSVKAVAKGILAPLFSRYIRRQLHGTEANVLAAQIEHHRPDVILNQEMAYVRSGFLRSIKTDRIKVIGQIAAALPAGERFDAYNLVISSLPNLVTRFRQVHGIRAELNRLAFEPSVLDSMGAARHRDIPVSFVGSLSRDHRSRITLLELLAERVDLQIWGGGIHQLPRSSPLHRCFRGEAWGRDMYDILLRSKVTINHHIDLAEGYANNMRLYEATGCGSLMLVDAQRNLRDVFEPGEQVVTYSNARQCAQEIERLLCDHGERTRIALAGQHRTLSEHTYFRRTGEQVKLLEDCG